MCKGRQAARYVQDLYMLVKCFLQALDLLASSAHQGCLVVIPACLCLAPDLLLSKFLGGGGPYPDGAPDAATHLRNVFYRMGLNDQEIVVLSGAHTLGRAYPSRSGFGECSSFQMPITFTCLWWYCIILTHHAFHTIKPMLSDLATFMCLLHHKQYAVWPAVCCAQGHQPGLILFY